MYSCMTGINDKIVSATQHFCISIKGSKAKVYLPSVYNIVHALAEVIY